MGRSKLDGREEEIKGLLELNVSKASFALDKSSSTSLRSVQFCSPEKSLDHYTVFLTGLDSSCRPRDFLSQLEAVGSIGSLI